PQTLTEQQMIAEGYRERVERTDPLGSLTAGDVMSSAVLALPAAATIAQVVEMTGDRRHRQYPVVTADGVLAGILTSAAIIASVRQAKLATTVGELIEQPKVVGRADESLHDVVARMAMENVDRCPVVAADGSL